MMGLLDMYLYAGNGEALEIVKKCADWFDRFSGEIPRETMDDMMDLQETGGIMELWADLYAVTGDPKHLELMRRYERPRLTEPVLRGEDILTNRHANTTIPESTAVPGPMRSPAKSGTAELWNSTGIWPSHSGEPSPPGARPAARCGRLLRFNPPGWATPTRNTAWYTI